jgi:hypothetical protein
MRREESILDQMMQTLQFVAADYSTQIQAFPDFVFVPDEVVSTFEENYLLFPQIIRMGLVNELQVEAVDSVNNLLSEMQSMPKVRNIWSLKAMKRDPEWDKLREFAKNALIAFEKPLLPPTLNWITYVKSKKK